MPASVAAPDRRDSRLLPGLFWAGVGLAPVAALILLVADSNGPLRIAAVLAIAAVVLIGLSVALRDGGDGAHADAEELRDEVEEQHRQVEALRREIEALRQDQHGEVAAAAQRGDAALDATQRLQEQVSALRRRLDAAAAGIAADPDPPAGEPAGAGRARIPAADPYDNADHPRYGGGAPPGRARVPSGRRAGDEPPAPGAGEDPPVRRPRPTPRYAAEPAPAGSYDAPAGRAPRPPQPAAPEAQPGSGGVIRHTETVHVTRHTVVDGPAPRAEAAWPGRDAEPAWPGRHAEPGRPGRHLDPGGSGRHAESDWSDPDEGPGGWSQLHAGDRWAEMRDDERGREVRVGERRAAAHADATGSAYRVEDRWAALRRGGSRREPDPGGPRGRDGGRPPSHGASGQRRGAAEPEPHRPSRHQRADEGRYATRDGFWPPDRRR